MQCSPRRFHVSVSKSRLCITIAVAGGDTIRCAPTPPYGTQETADNAVKALRATQCLPAGPISSMIVVGPNLKKPCGWRSVETLAADVLARPADPKAQNILSKAGVDRVIEKFKTPGQIKEPAPVCC